MGIRYREMKKSIFVTLFVISLLLYLEAPENYNYVYNVIAVVVFLISVILYYGIKKKSNYFDFDTLFIVAYFITSFVYPIFVYPITPYILFFSFPFNENVITRATCLSLVGGNAYMLGNIVYREKIFKFSSAKLFLSRSVLISYLLFAFFLIAGGYSYYKNLYSGEEISSMGSLHHYLNAFLRASLIISSLMIVYKARLFEGFSFFKKRKSVIAFLVLILAYSMLLLSTGARGATINLLLVLIWLYAYYIRPIKLIPLLVFIFVGAFFLAFIRIYRSGDGFVDMKGQMDFVNLFLDLIINNRNTYVALDYVDRNGVTYGESLLAPLLKIVPLLSGFVHNLFSLDVYETSSSMFLTSLTLGKGSRLGLGTTIIADLYLAFGLIGVVCFMFLLGYLVHMLENRMRYNQMYALIVYSTFIAYSVFLARGEYFFPMGQITLGVLLYWFIVHVGVQKHKSQNSLLVKD